MDVDLSQQDNGGELTRKAIDTLIKSGNCAQTSFQVLQQQCGFESEDILKALTPFPGIALRGETCGAVIGCMMAIGLVYGRDHLDDWKGYIKSLPPSRRFCQRFEEVNGSTTCQGVLESKLGQSFNLADRAESLQYVVAGGPQACGDVVASAVGIAVEIIQMK